MPPATVEERALKASHISNFVAAAALLIAAGSAYFTNQQADEAKRANDITAATKAAVVYFESRPTSNGTHNWVITNRNKEPIFDVYYTYKVGGVDSGSDIRVGLLPPCSTVQLTPPTGSSSPESIKPFELLLRDGNGTSWLRDESGQVRALERGAIPVGEPETIGVQESLSDC